MQVSNAGANASWPSDVLTFNVSRQEAERETVQIEIYNKNETTDTLIGTCSYVLKPLLDKVGQVSAIELPLQQGGNKQQGSVKLKICSEGGRKEQLTGTPPQAQAVPEVVAKGVARTEAAHDVKPSIPLAVGSLKKILLKITGIEAKDMPETESGLTSLWDKQDPYVRFLIGDMYKETLPVRDHVALLGKF